MLLEDANKITILLQRGKGLGWEASYIIQCISAAGSVLVWIDKSFTVSFQYQLFYILRISRMLPISWTYVY